MLPRESSRFLWVIDEATRLGVIIPASPAPGAPPQRPTTLGGRVGQIARRLNDNTSFARIRHETGRRFTNTMDILPPGPVNSDLGRRAIAAIVRGNARCVSKIRRRWLRLVGAQDNVGSRAAPGVQPDVGGASQAKRNGVILQSGPAN